MSEEVGGGCDRKQVSDTGVAFPTYHLLDGRSLKLTLPQTLLLVLTRQICDDPITFVRIV